MTERTPEQIIADAYPGNRAASAKGLTADKLRSMFHYNPDTGIFTRIALLRTSGKAKIGDCAGHVDGGGYLAIKIMRRQYRSHRLAFLYMTGEFPESDVDHINGDKLDNKWLNLRLATASQNIANACISSKNTSGYRGVSWHKKTEKWVAYIGVLGKRKSLGYFSSLEEAASTAKNARQKIWGEFAR